MASLIPSLIGAGGSILGSLLGGREREQPREYQESAVQKKQRNLIDELLQSLGGRKQYGDLFTMDEDAFQKSYVDPAKQRFNSQIAPQIQQQYIGSGQQRGTGLDDTLARAGVDLDQMLNQQYGQMQQRAQQNQLGAIGGILGQGPGYQPLSPAPEAPGFGQRFGEAAGGYLTSDAFTKSLGSIFDKRPEDKKPESKGWTS